MLSPYPSHGFMVPPCIGYVWPWWTLNCYFNTKHAVWAQVMVHLYSCNVLLHFSTGSTPSSNAVSLEIQFMSGHAGSVCQFHLLSKCIWVVKEILCCVKNNRQSLVGGAAVPPRFRMILFRPETPFDMLLTLKTDRVIGWLDWCEGL